MGRGTAVSTTPRGKNLCFIYSQLSRVNLLECVQFLQKGVILVLTYVVRRVSGRGNVTFPPIAHADFEVLQEWLTTYALAHYRDQILEWKMSRENAWQGICDNVVYYVERLPIVKLTPVKDSIPEYVFDGNADPIN
jgi:hypothetical protein